MNLHDFLHDQGDAILRDWEQLDRASFAAAQDLSVEALRDSIPVLLGVIADKSRRAGKESAANIVPLEIPKEHAGQRWRHGFSLEEVTREYGLLRTVILQRLAPRVGQLPAGELLFLDEALDQAIIEAVTTFVESANKVLESERERLLVTLRSIADGVISSDAEACITYLNPAAERITGWSEEDALGRPIREVLVMVDEDTRERLPCLTEMATENRRVSHHPIEALLRARDGGLVPVEETAAPLWDASDKFLGVVTSFRDVSKIRALTLQLSYLAAHDSLTALPNRTLFFDRITHELTHARRHRSRAALLYLDVDGFKRVNDTFGHSSGDRLLEQVAERLRGCVRGSDTISRLGGDEFAVLLTEWDSFEHLREVGEKVVDVLREPYRIDHQQLEISASVGVSIFPEDGQSPETLIKHADMAMYQAKLQDRPSLQFFSSDMNRRAIERRDLKNELRHAITAGELCLEYQPKISLRTGRAFGAEALLRWAHPERGAIEPDHFVPLAEENRDLMVSVGGWVLEEACRQARSWLDAGHPPLSISVNVSIVQLQNDGFVGHVADALQRFGLQPDNLQLELTESVLMSDVQDAADRVRELKALGVCIAVDDFGTGYSSLSYLKNLPVDELKIDRSFVCDIGSDADSDAMVQAIIRIGQSLQLRVVAEGVEHQAAASFLAANGCDGVQGFHYSRPLVPEELERRFLVGSSS